MAPSMNRSHSHSQNAQASTNYKEAFALFDKRGNGRVALESLGDLLRACGQNPTIAEVRDLEKGVGGDFDFESFQKVLNRPGGFRDPGEPEEYCRGFQVFDKDMTGFIGVGQLRYILTNLGEKMSDDEVDELLKAVDTSSGEINYTGALGDGAQFNDKEALTVVYRPRPDDIGELISAIIISQQFTTSASPTSL